MTLHQITPLDALHTPTCKKCGTRTRLLGLEPDSQRPDSDLCTYECMACGHLQTRNVARAKQAS